MRKMVEAEEKMRREKLEREYFLNPKEKAELKNTQPKSSEPQTQPRKRDDDRGR
jgi:dephospho-CoA kinase